MKNKLNFFIKQNERDKSNNGVIRGCINVTTVNKYLIQKRTYSNMLKFIQILKEIKKLQTDKKK